MKRMKSGAKVRVAAKQPARGRRPTVKPTAQRRFKQARSERTYRALLVAAGEVFAEVG